MKLKLYYEACGGGDLLYWKKKTFQCLVLADMLCDHAAAVKSVVSYIEKKERKI